MSGHFYGCRSFARHFDDLMDDTYFEINGQMISYLPKFRGAHVDNPLIHLRDLHIACNTLRPRGVNEADFMLRMFVYSLTGYAKSWLLSLSVSSMPQWEKMRQLFLMEYSIKQHPRETTYEYLERFRDMWDTCLDYSLPDHVVALSFLDGMNSHEREVMDVMAGGEIMECYPEDVWNLIYQRAAQTNPYKPTTPTYKAHLEDIHYIAPEWEQRMQDVSDMLAKLREPPEWEHRIQETSDMSSNFVDVSQVISITPEEQSLPQKSASIPLAQTERTTNPVAQPEEIALMQDEETCYTHVCNERNNTINTDDYLETVMEDENMEEVYEDKESKSLPMPVVMDDMIMSDSIEEEEALQDEACLTLVTKRNDYLENHAKNLIPSQGFVGTCTNDFLIMPDYFLSSHVQDHELGVSFGIKKVWGSSGEMCRKTMCIILCDAVSLLLRHKRQRHSMFGWKPGWIPERSAYGATNKILKMNWRSQVKAKRKIVDEEVSSHGVLRRMRHSRYVWKPGWDFSSAHCDKATQTVRSICRKFDGVHPWAPNL